MEQQESLKKDSVYYPVEVKSMPKINEGLILMLQAFTDEELTEEEIEEIETALDKEQQKEFEEALQSFFDEREELPNKVNRAAAVLTKLIIALAAETEEEEEEEEERKKKVKKSPSWGFTLVPPKED